MRRTLQWIAGALLLAAPAIADEPTDLREFRLGMPVSALPEEGYTGFVCAAEPARALAGWQDWQSCPADTAGRHAIRFRYDVGDTKVAGHEVLLTLLVGAPGQVDGLEIDTDPAAHLYMHKKAYLLGLQARSRYGQDGWTCTQGTPTAQDQPVGGTFVEERCEKSFDGRHVIVERKLLRHPDQSLKDFVGETRISILRAG